METAGQTASLKGNPICTRQQGSITIFLLLSLLLILALLCTLTESARVNCMSAKLRGITYMAADSCFSQYARELFDEYGIMALWETESEFTADFNSYITRNLRIDDLDIYRDVSLYPLHHEGTAIKEVEWLTDDNGMVFARQVQEYMQYYAVREVLELLLSQLNLFRSGNALSSFMNKINEYRDVFLKVGDTVVKIQSAADQVKSIAYNPKSILGDMAEDIEWYKETGDRIYIDQFNNSLWNLAVKKDQVDTLVETITEGTNDYYLCAGEAQNAILELRTELENHRDTYSEDTIEAIEQQLEILSQKNGESGTDYYQMERNLSAAQAYQEELEVVEPLIETMLPSLQYENILDYESLIDDYRAALPDFTADELGLDGSTQVVKKEDSGFLSTIGNIFTKGLLRAVCDGEISSKKIDRSDFPSRTRSGKKSSVSNNLLSASYSQLLFGEYILTHFGNYAEPREDTPLSYEAEYILAGKDSDEANLKKVVEDLVLLRSGLNLVSFLQDAQKSEEAELMAMAIVGFTGIGVLIESVKMLIISIWCLAESFCDVKALLAGGKVEIIKAPEDWSISAIGLKNFSKQVIPAASGEHGIGYQEYLRVMLLTEGLSDQSYRTMDMIQANACSKYEPEFRMKECMSAVTLEVQYSGRQLFTTFPFVSDITGNAKGIYAFTMEQSYGY